MEQNCGGEFLLLMWVTLYSERRNITPKDLGLVLFLIDASYRKRTELHDSQNRKDVFNKSLAALL